MCLCFRCVNIQFERDSVAKGPGFSKFFLSRDRTWEEQKTEHALLSLVTWFQAQPPAFLINQGLRSEGSYFFWWTWNLRLSTLSSSQWSLFISDLQIVFIFVVTVWQFFCIVGFKVFSAIRASRLQLLM